MQDHHTLHLHVRYKCKVQIQKTVIWSNPTGHMFEHKTDKILKNFPNVFGIADDILVVGYDTVQKHHDETLQHVLQICRQVNLKLNRDKYHFRCTLVLCFGEVIPSHEVQPDQ